MQSKISLLVFSRQGFWTVMLRLEWWIHLVLIFGQLRPLYSNDQTKLRRVCLFPRIWQWGQWSKSQRRAVTSSSHLCLLGRISDIQHSKEMIEQCKNGLSSICGSLRCFLCCHAWEIILATEMQSAESTTAHTPGVDYFTREHGAFAPH